MTTLTTVNLALVWDGTADITVGPRDRESQEWIRKYEIHLSPSLSRVRRRYVGCHFGPRQCVEAAAMLQAEATWDHEGYVRAGYPPVAAGFRVRAGQYVDLSTVMRSDGTAITEQEFVEIDGHGSGCGARYTGEGAESAAEGCVIAHRPMRA